MKITIFTATLGYITVMTWGALVLLKITHGNVWLSIVLRTFGRGLETISLKIYFMCHLVFPYWLCLTFFVYCYFRDRSCQKWMIFTWWRSGIRLFFLSWLRCFWKSGVLNFLLFVPNRLGHTALSISFWNVVSITQIHTRETFFAHTMENLLT